MSSKGNISTANWQSMLFLTGVGRNIQQEATMLGFKAVHLWGNLPSNGSYHKDAVARAFPMVRGQQMTFNGKPIKATYEVRVKNTAQSVLEIRYGEYKMVSRIVGESYFNNVRDFYMKIETLFMPLDTIYSLSRYGKAAAKSKSIDNL